MDTMKIPRPCAFRSYNLTSVEYYRGQKEMRYDVYDENPDSGAAAITQLSSDAKLIMQNGRSAEALARYS